MAFLDELQASVGDKWVLQGEDAAPFLSDLKGPKGPALAVVRPGDTEQVAAVVALCHAHDVAIVPQGGNTNICRMAVPEPDQPSIVLSLSRMNRVLDVDAACYSLTAEAGCLLQVAQEAAAEAHRCFAPDWGARGTATIGGAIATNGGGLNVIRYGTTRDQILGLEVVLPDGQIWNGLRALRKDNSGYDLKQMFIGSEGTLGVVTKAVFKLHPAQPISQSAMAVPADMSRMMDLLELARDIGGDRLTAFELMSGLLIDKALARYPDLRHPMQTRAPYYLLVRFSDKDEVSDTMMTFMEQALEGELLEDAIIAQSGAQEANIWELREQMIPHQYFIHHGYKWDVSVPISRMADFIAQIEDIARDKAPEAALCISGHIGDGNIHLDIFPEIPKGPEFDALGHILLPLVDQLIWSMGGSIVAEHGVGSEFTDRMRQQKPAVEYAMMQGVKAMLDPKGLMNPGKLLQPD